MISFLLSKRGFPSPSGHAIDVCLAELLSGPGATTRYTHQVNNTYAFSRAQTLES